MTAQPFIYLRFGFHKDDPEQRRYTSNFATLIAATSGWQTILAQHSSPAEVSVRRWLEEARDQRWE